MESAPLASLAELAAYLGEEVLGRERFGDIGIGAQREPLAHLGLAALGGQHDDARSLPLGTLADLLTHLETAFQRQHHIGQDEVGTAPRHALERFLTVARDDDVVTGPMQQVFERDDDVGLVIGDQHGLGHGAIPAALGSATQTLVSASPCGNGIVKLNFAPFPDSLSTHRRPPKCLTICLLMESPRPVPPGFCVNVSPTCRNFSKMISWSSRRIPGPLS